MSKKSGKGGKGGKRHAEEEEEEEEGEEPKKLAIKKFDTKVIEKKMVDAVERMKKEFSNLRVGRANPAILDPVTMTIEDSNVALKDVAQVTIRDAQTLLVSVHDTELVPQIDNAIRDAGLNLNPIIEGKSIKVPIPKPTKETRDELTKLASKITENFKGRIRSVRQEGMKDLKKNLKAGQASDEIWTLEQMIESLTVKHTKLLDESLKAKTKEILS